MTAPVGTNRGDQDWRRLNVRMLAVHPVMELIRFIPVILAVVFVGTRSGHGGGWWGLIGLGVGIVLGLLRWATTQYRITDAHVEVRRGLLGKSVLTVPRDRVRSVDVTSHFMHRLLGLTRVQIGTGQTDRQRESGVTLDGLTKQDGARLRVELLHRGRVDVPTQRTVATTDTPLAALDPRWIRYGPFTLSGLVTIGVVMAFAWRTINETDFDPNRIGVVHDALKQVSGLTPAVASLEIAVIGIIVVAVFSTIAYALAFWNYALTRSSGGTLHVSRGLITTRSTTIEERRLRGVEYSEPLLLRAVGGARDIAITTGLRVGRGAERGGSLLMPPAPATEARRVASIVLGDPAPVSVPLTRHPGAALRRRLSRALLTLVVLLAVPALIAWRLASPLWIIVPAAVLTPLLLLLGLDRYRSLGHAIVDNRLVFRQGSLVRRRCMIDSAGVVGWTIRQSIFQRRAGLVTLTATTAAGRQRYELPDVDAATAVRIADQVMPNLITPFLVA